MVMLPEFDEIAPNRTAEDFTSEQIQILVNSLVEKPEEGYDPLCVDQAVRGLQMPRHIAHHNARVLAFANSFFERLEQIGYGEFSTDHPEKTTKLICKHLLSPKLRGPMNQRIEFDKALKMNVKNFVRIIRREVIACQVYAPLKGVDSEKSAFASCKESDASPVPGKDKAPERTQNCLCVCILRMQRKRYGTSSATVVHARKTRRRLSC